MKRLVWAALLSTLCAGAVLAQGGIGPIGNLQGRVNASNALMVTSVAVGTTGAATAPIANLPGKVDASNNLLVAMDGLTPTQGTITTDQSAISTSATWNSVGTTFTHWKAVITDTASAAGSMALQLFGGASGTTSLFSVSKLGTITAGASIFAAGHVVGSSNRGILSWNGDGIIGLLNNAGTDFNRLQFGCTTSSCPALSRSAAELRAALADASAYAGFGASYLHVNGQGRLATTADGVFRLSNEAIGRTLTLDSSGTPTCSTNCGTSPSVTGVNSAFTVTMGATGVPASGWVVTFNGTLAAAPQCMVTMAKTGMGATKQALTVVTTTTTMSVVTNGAAPANGDVYTVLCSIGQ